MRSAVIVFPGSNCDEDAAKALKQITGKHPFMVWHRETALPALDLVLIPGGFSYGDYLRSGAIAARSPVMKAVREHARAGRLVAGICNGFQVLTETGVLPGALMRNANLHFICKSVALKVERTDTPFTTRYRQGEEISIPVAHHDGNFFAGEEELKKIEAQGQVVFRYTENPNGSRNDIAGVCNKAGNVLGMMPHPERAMGMTKHGDDGVKYFKSMVESLS